MPGARPIVELPDIEDTGWRQSAMIEPPPGTPGSCSGGKTCKDAPEAEDDR